MNDDQNGSFEDEENDDEHFQPVDHPDGQNNGETITKAHALYDFSGNQNLLLPMFLPIFLFRSRQ